jgi:dephospho-CoA kinase
MSTKIIGLTGGIGSGKTTVAKHFHEIGIPIYIADVEAKKLMNSSKVLKRHLKQLFGDQAYLNDELNKVYIASKIFSDKALLEKMNAIVHPKVANHFKKWLKKQNSTYVIYESALIFENDTTEQFQYIITVTAPLEIRIERVKNRDNSSEDKVKSIINNQLSDDVKISKSDFIIKNTDLEATKCQVEEIHIQIIDLLKN